ncbi:MAG TPA: hypothetical protein VF613_14820 [Longimicrobium sp.]
MKATSRVLACALSALVLAAPAAAQEGGRPAWVADFTVVSANVLFGGLSAGAVQKARGGSFRDGFARGAAGGLGVYAGKRIAVGRWEGAGLVGRQVASVGSSVVWNAGQGRPSLEEVALPLGPVRFYVRPRGGGPRVRARVDALSLAATLYAVARPELEWDARRSLSSGAAVFQAPDHGLSLGGEGAAALAYPGNVYLGATRGQDAEYLAHSFAHERVHNLQADQIYFALGRPLQEATLNRLPGGRVLGRWVDFDLSMLGIAARAAAIDEHGGRPWEMEAIELVAP